MEIVHSEIGKLTILVVYVNDISNAIDEEERERLEKGLMSEFTTKNLGKMKLFLRIEVADLGQGVLLSQQKYILNFLTEIGFSEMSTS